MKCIRRVGKQDVRRVPDDEAAKLVKSGGFVYCPKHEFKAAKLVAATAKKIHFPPSLQGNV
jgi:hypothetical protein